MNPSHVYAPLEGRFEIIKEIGDGSFGNVVLARVRTAGANVARRGTMVSRPLQIALLQVDRHPGCDQDDEEDLRLLRAVFRTARSHLPANPPYSCPPRSCVGYLPRPIQPKTAHLHGIHGR